MSRAGRAARMKAMAETETPEGPRTAGAERRRPSRRPGRGEPQAHREGLGREEEALARDGRAEAPAGQEVGADVRLESPAFPDGAEIPARAFARRRRRLASAPLVGRAGGNREPGAPLRRPRRSARHLGPLGRSTTCLRPFRVCRPASRRRSGSRSGGVQGKNDYGEIGWGGPAPPRGHGTHHYSFRLYALDGKLELPPGATKAQLEAAMKGHVLAEAKLTGTYRRD